MTVPTEVTDLVHSIRRAPAGGWITPPGRYALNFMLLDFVTQVHEGITFLNQQLQGEEPNVLISKDGEEEVRCPKASIAAIVVISQGEAYNLLKQLAKCDPRTLPRHAREARKSLAKYLDPEHTRWPTPGVGPRSAIAGGWVKATLSMLHDIRQGYQNDSFKHPNANPMYAIPLVPGKKRPEARDEDTGN